ncbi:MAG: carbon monoxide dehydrogenase [Acidobacteria bacterium RIFCSPLOWO2_02_FULL_67_21]|nr:MAG: carbon monoxide dehydrogenase [Acidobacteria bacterium RIFCSPLOWO2_02_FULL_67_21]
MTHTMQLTVNGESCRAVVEPRTLLVHLLRDQLGLTGTHVGCVVGECGACSVLVDGALVKSCLMLAVQADGCTVTTIEGLSTSASTPGLPGTPGTPGTLGTPAILHPVQEAFIRRFALQCGFCTPGFVMAAAALLARNPNPTEVEIRQQLASNLCMCTGYVQIVEAVQEAATRLREWQQSSR